ncbi:squalene--hopene cyclase [Humisphaera borealis]|uniref:Squalene--hopene cyclase n=1 Tax=Humisphaera borealis TaxID=2807512 RepID=A0A7M2WYW5_9BACT|nr:squalene--hopene cyclase [Humisphaera borealis]QOV90698.1 squalene--hopene cyclase [Humisphaera borealis]
MLTADATAAEPLSDRSLETASTGTLSSSTLDRAIEAACEALVARQDPAGFWCAELQGDSILESEYLLLMWILGREAEPDLPLIANYLRKIQNPDGGWSLYPGGPADISGTVKGYFALKLMGDSPDAPHMRRARELILSLGGAEKCNTFTRFYFACLGQISFDACPSIPPEIVFLPKWFYFNLYHVSAWTRTMILPLGLVTTFRRARKLKPEQGISELYLDRQAANRLSLKPLSGLPKTWQEIFLRIDQLLKVYDKTPNDTLRQKAIKKAEEWILDHLSGSEGLGAIFPPMVYLLIVFQLLGYPENHPRVVKAHKELRDFFIQDGDEIRIQPCLSPMWDTGIALNALAEAGLSPGDDVARRSTQWLLAKECRVASDWQKNCRPVEASGWFFEFENAHYPDTDDTAMVCTSLSRVGGPDAQSAVKRGVNWLLAMQNDDGGWAAFDRTTDRPLLEKIPFADHNAMQDPSCPDITGRVIEGLGRCGMRVGHPAIDRAVQYIRKQADADGAWWGRWGVNYVYGTWQVLTGLKAVGQDMSESWTRKAADWLLSVQKPDGSFGETCASYDDARLKGQGDSTASQTAWGAMGLMAVHGASHPAIEKAIRWLIETQTHEGSWEETNYTGTGFPRVFYLKYHYYRLYFPLTALARYRRLRS